MNVGFLTFAAAGRRIGLGRSRISQLVKEGRIGTVEFDGRRYVSVPSLAAFVANRIRNSKYQLDLFKGERK